MKASIIAIIKNEMPYLEEWISHHISIGFNKFFIADNGSTDGGLEYMRSMKDSGIVEVNTFIPSKGIPPQLPAYNFIFNKYKNEADWFAFVDADEFIVSPSDGSTITKYLSKIGEQDDIGAVAINWACFGSSGEQLFSDRPVVERFQRRAEKDYIENHHYKSIVRSKAFAGTRGTPHHFQLKSGYRYVQSDGGGLVFHEQRGEGLSQEVLWEPLRINHYAVKSHQEFFEKKGPRGRATVVGQKKGETYFRHHDRNDILDPYPIRNLEKLKVEMAILSKIASKVRQRAISSSGIGHMHIDVVRNIGSVICAEGWAIEADGSPTQSLRILAGGKEVETQLSVVERPDVERKVSGASRSCGFSISFSLLDTALLDQQLTDVVLTGGSDTHQLKKHLDVPIRSVPEQDPDIPSTPSMPGESVAALRAAMADANVYLEYGTGGSSLMAEQNIRGHIIAVESDWRWLRAVKRIIHRSTTDPNRFHYLHADIGPTKEWGYPVSESAVRKWSEYALGAWKYMAPRGLSPDLILIDGRFRRACFLASLIFARPGTRIFFDDYLDRPHYHSVEEFVERERTVDRVAEFVRPQEIDNNAIWLALVEATMDTR